MIGRVASPRRRIIMAALVIAIAGCTCMIARTPAARAAGSPTTRWVGHGGRVTTLPTTTTTSPAAPPAAAGSPATLPATSFGDLVVDATNGHVFLSAPDDNEILVLDYQGDIVKTISAESGADAMVLDTDTLYVTLSGGIDRIDTRTLAETKPLTSASLVAPDELVLSNGALWTTTGNVGNVCLAKVDTSTGAVTTYTASQSLCNDDLGLRTNPAATDMLITWDQGVSPATITTLDASTDPPSRLNSVFEEHLGGVTDLAAGPTATSFVATGPSEFDELRYSDLQQNGIVYPATNGDDAVATTAARGGMMVGGVNAASGAAIWAYGYDQPYEGLFTGYSGNPIPPRGVAFRPDGYAIFAVSEVVGYPGPTSVSFGVIPLSNPAVSGVTPQHGSSAGGTAVTISGINFFDGTPACQITAVAFGTMAAGPPTSCSDTSLTVAAPAAWPDTVDVTVTTQSGTSAVNSEEVYTYDGIVLSAVSDSQYHLGDSDGSTWKVMDAAKLELTVSPSAPSDALLGVNADLWTAESGYNQDIGLFVGIDGTADTLLGWKESGGFGGTFSPNAAYLQVVQPLMTGHTYVFSLKWKTNRPASGATIYAGAGPINGRFSPTRLTANIVSQMEVASSVTTAQYTLNGGLADHWYEVDPSLETSITSSTTGDAVLSVNADLWTDTAGLNQDIGIFVSDDNGPYVLFSYTVTGPYSLVAWKESGGSAGTYSPNAAFAQGTYPVVRGHAYRFALAVRPNKNAAAGQSIAVGAGPADGQYSPTRLTVETVPASLVSSAVSTNQYSLTNSDGQTWAAVEPSSLSVTVTPTVNASALVTANADLWTATAGYNQDLGVTVSGGGPPSTLIGWKESGGLAGTFSPNAAFLEIVYPMTVGYTYTFTLVWKTNIAANGATIYAGAGPADGGYSPTRLTVTTTQ